MTRYFMSLTFNPPLQETLSNAGNPMPGLPAGVLVNSTVYALGLQILLKGAACRCYVPQASPAAPTACAGSTHFDMQLRPRLSTGLTPAGVAHSWVLGCTIYSAFGPGGYLLVCLYFILGSAVRCLHDHRGLCNVLLVRLIWAVWFTAHVTCSTTSLRITYALAPSRDHILVPAVCSAPACCLNAHHQLGLDIVLHLGMVQHTLKHLVPQSAEMLCLQLAVQQHWSRACRAPHAAAIASSQRLQRSPATQRSPLETY